MILSLGEEDADRHDDEKEGGEQQEQAKRLAARLQPPASPFPPF